MPEKIIKKFQKQYGKKKGKKVFYATANKQKRDPETFQKESVFDILNNLPLVKEDIDANVSKDVKDFHIHVPKHIITVKKDTKKKDSKNVEYFSEKEAIASLLALEAANEGEIGMQAIMNVIMNRSDKNPWKYFKTISEPYQFSAFNYYTSKPNKDPRKLNYLIRKAKKDNKTFQKALSIVEKAYSGELKDITNGASHYYAKSGKHAISAPDWAKNVKQFKDIGNHRFLKLP